MHHADYDVLLALVDKAMADTPNYETKLLGAAAYAQAGRLPEAETIAREVIATYMQPRQSDADATDTTSVTNKAIVGGFIGLLAEIATRNGRLDEAETLLQQALALSKDHSPYANCAARLALLRGQVDVATRYLNIASAGYRKNHPSTVALP